MCEAFDNLRAEAVEKGIKEGIKEGKITILVMLLKENLGSLSNETIEYMKKGTIEQLDQLTLSVFRVKDEQDVLDILS